MVASVARVVVAMLALVAISALMVQPLIAGLRAEMLVDAAARERFAFWHAVSSALYALTSVLAVILVVRVRRLIG